MPENSVIIYQQIDSIGNLWESIRKYKKEVDGVSIFFAREITEDWAEILRKIKGEGLKELIILEGLGKGAEKLSEVIMSIKPDAIALPNLGLISELMHSLEDLKVRFGAVVRNPFPNFQALRKVGIEFVIMPTALIKGRVVKEAKASNLELIAYLVNDPATYLKVKSSGVSGIITKNPGLIREAEKLKL